MRRLSTAGFLTGLAFLFSFTACKSSTTPPAPMADAFAVTNFPLSVVAMTVSADVDGTYSNATNSDAIATGTIDWGDGNTTNFSSSTLQKNITATWLSYVQHAYTVAAVYTVNITATAPYSNGSITSTYSKKIAVD